MLLKIIQWIVLNVASVCGLIQALIKFVKELVTAVMNLLASVAILLPGVSLAQANKITLAVRSWIEWFDGVFQKLADMVLKFSVKE